MIAQAPDGSRWPFAKPIDSATRRKSVSDPAGAMLAAGTPNGLNIHRPAILRARTNNINTSGAGHTLRSKRLPSAIASRDIFVGRVVARGTPGQKAFALGRKLPSVYKSLGDRIDPIENHPLLAAIDDPNELMIRANLLFVTVASLKLTGRCHWWMYEFEGRLRIWPLPSHWLEPVDALRTKWIVRPPGFAEPFELPAEDVATFALPDPGNPFGFSSPLQSQADAIGTDEAIQKSQHRAFVNGVFPGVMIRVGRLPGMPGSDTAGERPVLEPEQRKEITEAVKALYGGAMNMNAPLIIDGMIEGVDRLTNTPAEMGFLESGKATKARIFQAFGVNPLIVGETENANRAQAVVAEESFCENTLNPIIELMSQVLTGWIGPRFAGPNEKLIVWLEPARLHDPEQTLKEWDTAR